MPSSSVCPLPLSALAADDDAAAATAGGDGDDDDPRGHVHLATLLMEELQALLGGGAGELLPASGARVKAYASELCKVLLLLRINN